MSFVSKYNKVKADYYIVSKKILNYESRRDLNDNDRIKRYTKEIVTVYNNFVKFVRENGPKQNAAIQGKVDLAFQTFYGRNFLRCLHALNLDTVLTDRYSEVNLEALIPYEEEASGENFGLEDGNEIDDLKSDDESEINLRSSEKTNLVLEPNSNSEILARNENISNMVLTRVDYHSMCTRTINAIYSGDPLGLQPFIDAIEALEELDEAKAHTATLKRCILMKLSGIARECIPKDENGALTIEQIKAALRKTIKPETSGVVEGRLLALKADRTNFTDFAKRAEALAEQFQRSLTLEGMPHELANKYAIKSTIELCRSNSTLSGVKNVLSSVPFENSKEVIAKFITQTRTETGEQQVLHYQANRSFRSNRSNNPNQRGRNNNFQRNSNGQNRHGNSNRNGYRNNTNNRGNFRGRFQGYRGNNWRNGNRNNNRNVLYAENGTAPPPGAAQSQQVQMQQAGNQHN